MDLNGGIYKDENDDFEFPSNIRQIGCIDDRIKVYMEDYVYTYLYQYAKASGGSEKLGVLVGRHFMQDDCDIVIISGAIQGQYTANENGGQVFTDETWNYVNEQMKVYFKGLEVVGWVHALSGYGAFLMAKDEEMHKMYFTKPYQQLFVIDAEDKMDRLFSLNSSGSGMREVLGYFIYYDKNRDMQEYMLENSFVKPKENININLNPKINVNDFDNRKEETFEDNQKKYNERIDAAKKIRSVLKEREEKVAARTRARYRALTGVCGMLCFFCFIMGIGLINSSERINRLETEVVSVKTKYTDISEQIQNSAVASVFAGQESSIPKQEYIEEEPKEKQENTTENETEVETKETFEEDEKSIPASYTIKSGDSLTYISTKFYGDINMVDEIMKANNMSDPDKIVVGKKIILP